MIERLVILCDGIVRADDLPERFQLKKREQGISSEETKEALSKASPEGLMLPEGGIDLNAMMDKLEKDLILQAIKRTGGVKSKAAALLGLNRTTLIEKMKKKGILTQPPYAL